MTKKQFQPLLMFVMVALVALPAFAGERLTFTNTEPKVLSQLASEGLASGLQVDQNGRALGELQLDGGLGAFYLLDGKALQANLYLDGGKDVYRFKGTEECAGLVEVNFGLPVLEAQIRASVSEGRDRWVTQAVATSLLPTEREVFAVRGGVTQRIEVAFTGGVDDRGEALTFTQTFDRAVGCDQKVVLAIATGNKRSAGGDLAEGMPAKLPRRDAGDSLLGQESRSNSQTFNLGDPSQTCISDDFNDNNLDGWTFSFIGDADQGGAVASGGTVKVTSDGTSYYHAPDNGGFLHRTVTGDFRAQVKLLGFPVNTGGGFKKTSLTVRSGLGPDDPRVTVQFIPNHPTYNTTAIQFDYRDAAGVEHELASTPLGVPMPAYLMIERRGTVFSAYYSTDGVSWIRQLGGAGNAVSIAMPGTLEIGMMDASYSATVTVTAEFDDFKACSPNVVNLPPIPPHGVCMPGTPIDILYLLDSTGSMTFPFTGGGISKLDAARQAIADMNDLIGGNLPGSRAALVTFQGGFTPAFNLNSSVHTLSHLTTDFDAVDAAAATINVAAINPDATTPIAIALQKTYDIFQAEADPAHIPVVIFIGDGWANIDLRGYGPSYYRFEEMQAISIGAYLPPGQVAWLGNFNGPINTYDGQALADAMEQTLRLKSDIPNFLMFTLGVHSNATFRPDLLGFMALYTGADFYDVTSAADLVNVLVGIYNGLDCGAEIGDRVWDDANGDGVQDGGEAGLAGVTVELVDSHGTVVDTEVTDASGNYLFGHVVPGTYTVRVVPSTLPAGWGTPTYDYDGIGTAHQAVVTVVDDQIFHDADFGYQRFTGAIGDRVWNDTNGNGVQEGGEGGIAGVTVELRDSANVVVATAVTDGNGNYNFTGLGPGTYTVTVVAATLGATNLPTFDRDGIVTPNVATVVLAANQTVSDADFGYRGCAGSISSRLWLDSNGNGSQDGGEPGIAGVSIELLNGANVVIATTVTSGSGAYSFTGLAPGNYVVRIVTATLPAGAVLSHDPDGGAPHQASVSLDCDEHGGGIDFGYEYDGSIGDRVWNDANGNGVQEGGEGGLVGVTVELRNSANVVVATAVTDGNGNYSFTGLGPDTYTVTVVPAGLGAVNIPTYDRDGIASANVASVVLAANQNVTDADFGYRDYQGAIGDRVWNDLDADGVQDVGEAGLVGVTVELRNAANVVIATTVTGANGAYNFTGLGPGTYTVAIVTGTLGSNTLATFDRDGLATPNAATVVLAADQVVTDADFGYRGPYTGSIGDRVWNDANGNGVQDVGEAGLVGVTVELRNAANVVIATTVTGANGIYNFPNLAPGNYTVTVVPAGLGATNIPTFDRDGIATANVAAVTLGIDQVVTDADFGYKSCVGSIGDRVWDDKNGNGVQDVGETGINNVTVQLVNASNVVVATTTTNSSGAYSFTGIAAGTYTVRIVTSSLPAGATPTYDLDGIATANQATVTLGCNQNLTTVDFGYRTCLGSIGDKVWLDKNGNGAQNSGEPGIAGVTVELVNSSNVVIATTTTNSSGNYTFTGLVGGTYTVRVVASTLPAGYQQTFDLDGVITPNTATVTLSCNQNKTDVDFGYKSCAGSIGDRVWDDKNGNGAQDSGETGISGVTVQLYNASNVLVATTTTNSSGKYTFANLAPATYTVKVVLASVGAGAVPTFDLDGIATANQATVTLTCAQVKTNVDFGYKFCLGWVGDLVWDDINGNGIVDNEKGIDGVKVELVDSSNVVVATYTTVNGGYYEFSNVPQGTYTVRVDSSTLPAGWDTATYDLDGLGSLHQATFKVGCCSKVDTVDFGYRNPHTGTGWCPRTIGYWKNHQSEWPVTSLTIGGVTYNQTQLVAHLSSTSSDASRLLIKQLVATLLNLAMGSDPWIQDIVDEANKFLVKFPPGSNPTGSDRDWALKLKDDLDKYNNDPACH